MLTSTPPVPQWSDPAVAVRPTPPMDQPGDVTRLLEAHAGGDPAAFDDLVGLVYEDLRGIAHRQLRGRHLGQTLNTTGLVHEAYVKLVRAGRARWEDRAHFFGITAHAMRQIITDYARRRLATKRGGGQAPEALDAGVPAAEGEARWLLDFDRALERLAEIDPRLVRVVELRFFSGLTEEETAAALEVGLRTVQRDWKRARAWLREALRG